jgi:hypothetical protein
VGLRKLDVSIQVLLQKCVALADGAVVHVIVKVRDHKRNGRQRREIRWEAGKRLVGAGRDVGEV